MKKKKDKKNKLGTFTLIVIVVILIIVGIYSIIYSMKKAGKAIGYSDKILQLYLNSNDKK